MDPPSWTVIGAIALLVAIGTAFRGLRADYREFGRRIDAQGENLRRRIDAQARELGDHIGQLRERMAHLEGLLEGVRERDHREAGGVGTADVGA